MVLRLMDNSLSFILRLWRVTQIFARKFRLRFNRSLTFGKAQEESPKSVVPLSVNYHFTRQCNYSCGFCFHTALTSFVLPIEKAKLGLKLLSDAGMIKVNFSGGEPFLHQRGIFLGELVKYCKEELYLDSVTVVTNGSRVTRKWFEDYGTYLDIMAVSCDSFDEEVNEKIGRHAKGKSHLDSLRRIRAWCREYQVLFKLNTVVNTYNVGENMCEQVQELQPCRWKVFQCLSIDEENQGQNALRQVEPFLITSDQFQSFLKRHESVSTLVPESNLAMRNSYFILDEFMRFLDNTSGCKKPSPSILDVGVKEALKFSGFDEQMFFKRGGKYNWSKSDANLEW
ncbi:S-adenosylmethionine-dependent nucleotide dehydratase RSAD2-like [Symsagittifera roscoffensis]|uniref:S-adenosylmethionine-dependent nucleotide dehydratase RSAD2-like n=1 Tax=Symsagittifera roscoffensis TaxID=84072 RepID=UPI00307C2521